jgi:hypothetical protein
MWALPPHYVILLSLLFPIAMCHLSISPLWSVWSLSHLIVHSPPAICPAPFHVSLPSRCARYISSPTPTTYCLPPCVFPCCLSHTSLLLIPPPPPHGFGATTPLLRPTLRAGLHAIHQAVQLIQVAARGAFHVIKVSSWPGCPQSQ